MLNEIYMKILVQRRAKAVLVTFLINLLVVLSISGCGVVDNAAGAVKKKIDETVDTAEQQVNHKIEETKNTIEYSAKEYVDKATASVVSDPKTTLSVFMNAMVNGKTDEALSHCKEGSQAEATVSTFSKEYFIYSFANSVFSSPERVAEAMNNQSLIDLGETISSKIISSYEVMGETEYSETEYEYNIYVKTNSFTDTFFSKAMADLTEKYADEAGIDNLKKQYEAGGSDDGALARIAEDMYYNHMDDLFSTVNYYYKNSFTYEDYYGTVVIEKVGDQWLVTEFE